MSYYIAADKFGNYDLAHYGVKGMKWGERKPEEYGFGRYADTIRNNLSDKKNRQKASESSFYNSSRRPRNAKLSEDIASEVPEDGSKKQNSSPAVNPNIVKEYVDATSETPKTDEDAQIAEANVAYQSALMNMQLLARIALSNGVSPSASSEYLEARKEAIKAKYELDKLTIARQERLAKEAPTMAAQRQIIDSNAKKKLAEDKKEEKKASADKNDAKKEDESDSKDKGISGTALLIGKRAADLHNASRKNTTRKKR